MLSRMGFTVLMAADGQDAVDLYRERKDEVSLVILDLTMPRMDGQEAFRELRELDPKVRVIVSSGYSEQEAIVGFSNQCLAGFLQKPYTMAQLTELLRVALAADQKTEA